MSLISKSTRAAATIFAIACCWMGVARAEEEEKLVVHEWGVLGVGLVDGQAVIGATSTYLDSLPEFVLRNDVVSPVIFEEQAIEDSFIILKPVVHFYGREGQEVEMTIGITRGVPVVYYPKPELVQRNRDVIDASGRHGKLTHPHVMKWKFSLSKRDPGDLPASSDGHWWQSARGISSDYVIMDEKGAGNERFVFYEGTTYRAPLVTAAVSEDSITVKNGDKSASAPVILIINDNGSYSGAYFDTLAAGAAKTLKKEALEPWDEAEILENCRKQWEVCGMSGAEAERIVEVWREELLEKPGFLLISRVPEPIYEEIFPITIKPEPTELKRACLVFDTLPGQGERRHWVPSIRIECVDNLAALAAEGFKERMSSRRKLIDMGEIITPFVNEVLADPDTDVQLRIAASNIRRILTGSQVHAPPIPADAPQARGRVSFEDLDEMPEISIEVLIPEEDTPADPPEEPE